MFDQHNGFLSCKQSTQELLQYKYRDWGCWVTLYWLLYFSKEKGRLWFLPITEDNLLISTNFQSPMFIKAWVSLCLPVPHQPCYAPSSSSLNVILAFLWHGATQKCALNQSLEHRYTSCAICAKSCVFNSILRAQSGLSCSLPWTHFGLCPIIW